MRGIVVIVSPSGALARRVMELAEAGRAIALELDADKIDGVAQLELDPLGELRINNAATLVTIALQGTVPDVSIKPAPAGGAS